MTFLQVLERSWPAGAVHDSVQAVVRGGAFKRSLQSSLLERFLAWSSEGITRALRFLDELPGSRAVSIAVAAVLVVLVVARVIVAARARDPHRAENPSETRARLAQDPWRLAEELRAAGDYEGAAHALYRSVITSIATRERLRLDPSRTSGDYTRELRQRGSSAYGPFRAFARRFDAAIFGRATLDAALVQELHAMAASLRAHERAA